MGLLDQFQAYIDANTPRSTRPVAKPATVIDQGLLGGRIGQVPQRAQEMYRGLLGAPAELAALGSPAMRSKVDQAMTKPQPIDKDKAMQMAMDTLQTTSPVGGLVGMVSKLDGPAMSVADDAAKVARQPTQYELAHQVAQKNAVDMLGLPPNNTAMDRARAMGAEPMYHGSASDIQQLDPAMYGSSTGAHSAKQAFWGVSDPTTAGGYAEYAATGAPVKRLLDQADQYENAGNWDKYDEALAAAEKLEPELYNQPLRGQNIMPLMVMPRKPAVMDAKGAEFVDVEGGVNKFLRSAKLGGKDAAIFKNMSDDVGRNARPADHYAILDPSIVRSRFAAFDPARRNENDLLAGLAPYIGIGGLLSLGLMTPEQAQANQ